MQYYKYSEPTFEIRTLLLNRGNSNVHTLKNFKIVMKIFALIMMLTVMMSWMTSFRKGIFLRFGIGENRLVRPIAAFKGLGSMGHPVILDVGKAFIFLGNSISHYGHVINVSKLGKVAFQVLFWRGLGTDNKKSYKPFILEKNYVKTS